MSQPVPATARFADLAVGQQVSWRRTFSAHVIDAFAALSGDVNPLHMDDAFAARTKVGHRVAHGMLSAAYVSALVGTKLPGPGALWVRQQFEFRLPVYVDDEIEFRAAIHRVSASTRTITLRVSAANQIGDVVMTGEGTVMVLEEQTESGS